MPTEMTSVPFRHQETWVQVTRPTIPRTGRLPLVVLHGGPGIPHDYLGNLTALAEDTGRTVVLYDQIGCGRSGHLPDAPDAFWTPELFIEEFATVVDALGLNRYHLLGHSWGGSLGAEIAVRRPDGLASLILFSAPADMRLWVEGTAELRAELPIETKRVLDQHERDGTTDDPEYVDAVSQFYALHVCRLDPAPQDFVDAITAMEADPTVYSTMNGANEFFVTGTLRDWSIIDRLAEVAVATLVTTGEFDEARPVAWSPLVERIADVRWHVFEGASHLANLERPTRFREVVAEFLEQHEGPA